MSVRAPQPTSGHIFRCEGKRGSVWHAKYRLPDGVADAFAPPSLDPVASRDGA
jgi:hypothetical protein